MQGWEKSKHRVTIAFVVSACGISESQPIVIWQSENPCCFKGINKSSLPVRYYHQPKSWMTGEIMRDLLASLNRRLRSSGRSVLLLMDNAGCHPEDLREKFSNIKIVFLPANTTSKFQPLDLGIINNFKVHYRKLLMQHVLSVMEECTSASEILKRVTVLQALRWVSQAWKKVSSDIITKCFRRAGVLDQSFNVVRRGIEEDPFGDLDGSDDMEQADSQELRSLADQLHIPEPGSLVEMASADCDVPICSELDNEKWEEDFLQSVRTQKSTEDETDNSVTITASDSEDETEEQEIPPPKLKNLREVIVTLGDVHHYLDFFSYTEEATECCSLVSTVSRLQCSTKTKKQTTLLDYFNP